MTNLDPLDPDKQAQVCAENHANRLVEQSGIDWLSQKNVELSKKVKELEAKIRELLLMWEEAVTTFQENDKLKKYAILIGELRGLVDARYR